MPCCKIFLSIALCALSLVGCGQGLRQKSSEQKASEQTFSNDAFKQKLKAPTQRTLSNHTPTKHQATTSLSDQLVSLTILETTPLRDVFIALADQADLNLALPGKGLSKGVTYKAFKTPLKTAIQHLCRLGGLRYDLDHQTLFIAEDRPFLKTYNVQFLTGSRTTENKLAVTTTMNQRDPRAASGNSQTTISSVSALNFWQELEKNVSTLLPLSHKANTTTPSKTTKTKEGPHFVLHKQAGLLSIYGRQQQHNMIQSYLQRLQKLVSAQVLIEAKIIEVLLKEEFNTGINWSFLNNLLSAKGHFGNLPLASTNPGMPNPAPLNGALLNIHSSQLSAALSLMESFGTVRTIANPRLTVLNNQSAVFKVAQNEVFFTLSTEHVFTTQNRPHFETISSQVQTIPIGLVVTVQPSIDLAQENVTLFIKPAISRVVETREDPAVSIKSNNSVKSEIPVVQVREMDSIIKVRPGHTVVMGGLIEKITRDASRGLPGVHTTWLGRLLGSQSHQSTLSELVIFLTVHLPVTQQIQPRDRLLHTTL